MRHVYVCDSSFQAHSELPPWKAEGDMCISGIESAIVVPSIPVVTTCVLVQS